MLMGSQSSFTMCRLNLTSISPKILKLSFNLHMVKDDCPPGMADQYLTKLLKLRFSLHMVRDDLCPQVSLPVYYLKFLSSDLAWTWCKMIDPPDMTDQYLT